MTAQRPVLLFLHVPKTAGTTLTNCVYVEYAPETVAEYWEDGDWLRGGIYYFPRGIHEDGAPSPDEIRTLGRSDLRAVTGHFSFGIHQFVQGEAVYVTVLRNPVDRVVSLYYHALREPDDPFHERVAGGLGLEAFVAACPEAANGQTRRIAGAGGDALLDAAKENLERRFAVAGLTERFDETVVLLRRKLGWKRMPYYLPGLVNTRKRPRSAIDPDVLALIEGRNQLDRELYDHACELFSQAVAAEDVNFRDEVRDFARENERYIALCGAEAAY
jgi:hypothetical protein